MSLGTYERLSRMALFALSVAALSGFAPLALAQSAPQPNICGSGTPGLIPGVPPAGPTPPLCTEEINGPGVTHVTTGDTCGADRGATGCTANDFVGQAAVTSNSSSNCNFGDHLINQSLQFQITGSQSKRYAPGLFIAEKLGTDLNVAGTGTCSVVTFPTANNLAPARSPFPWFDANPPPGNPGGDKCGSYDSGFQSLEQVDGVEFDCNPDPDPAHNGALIVDFMILYSQNASGALACTGPADVHAGTGSKCTIGQTQVSNVVVNFNANPTCSFIGGQNGVTIGDGTFTKRFTVTNNGPQDAGVPGSNAVHIVDVLDPTFTVTNGTCTPFGGAVCPAGSLVSGNTVSGDIPTLPNGGSVLITITGTFPSGTPGSIENDVTLSINGQSVVPPVGWVNTCLAPMQLPVRLQDFDVK